MREASSDIRESREEWDKCCDLPGGLALRDQLEVWDGWLKYLGLEIIVFGEVAGGGAISFQLEKRKAE